MHSCMVLVPYIQVTQDVLVCLALLWVKAVAVLCALLNLAKNIICLE